MGNGLEGLSAIHRHAGGLHSMIVRITAGTRMQGHRHDDPTIVFVMNGELRVAHADGDVVERGPLLRLARPGAVQGLRAIETTDCLVITCGCSTAVARHASWLAIPDASAHRIELEHADSPSLNRLVEATKSGENLEGAVLELLTDVSRKGRPAARPAWLDSALEQLARDDGPRESAAAIAKRLGIHPVHLGRTVRRFTGLTVREFVRRERVLRGQELLRSEHNGIGRVAHDAGFADHAHFSREFARRHGHSPSQDAALAQPDAVPVQSAAPPHSHVGMLDGPD